MKKILLILFCLPMLGFGQDDDMINLQNEVNEINYRMDKHSKQYFSGVKVSLIGLGATLVGVAAVVNPLTYVGGGIILVGNIMIINSHKWFKLKSKQPYDRVQLDRIETSDWLRKNKDKSSRVIKRKTQLDNLLREGAISQEDYNNAVEDLQKFD